MNFGSKDRFIDDSRFDKVEAIEKNIPHKYSEVICWRCNYRLIATRPISVNLKDIECMSCGKGYVIETGETYE